MFEDALFDIFIDLWDPFTFDDYEKFCIAKEIVVGLTSAVHNQLKINSI